MGSITLIKGTKGLRYRAQVRRKGHPQQSENFGRKKDAEAWIRKIESELDKGKFLFDSKAKKRTVSDLLDRYEEDILPGKKSARDQSQQLEVWRELIGHESLLTLSPATLMEARTKLSKRKNRYGKLVSNSTVNRYLAALSHVLTVAETTYSWIAQNPMKKVPKLKEPQGRVRALCEEEIAQLLSACKETGNAVLELVVLIALTSGMRKGEVLGLRWDDILFEKGLAIIQDPKNGERRSAILLPVVVEELKKRKEAITSPEGLIFPNRKGTGPVDLKKPWARAVNKANLKDFRFHDLRHTAATLIANGGGSVPQIATVLGHKSFRMASRYAHLTENHTRELLESAMREIVGDD